MQALHRYRRCTVLITDIAYQHLHLLFHAGRTAWWYGLVARHHEVTRLRWDDYGQTVMERDPAGMKPIRCARLRWGPSNPTGVCLDVRLAQGERGCQSMQRAYPESDGAVPSRDETKQVCLGVCWSMSSLCAGCCT